jgi:AmmeMemoRadiSam system protein B
MESKDPMLGKRPGAKVRPPAVAGSFYPREANELKAYVRDLLPRPAPLPGGLCGVVAPHAGYMYSGSVAGKAFAPVIALRELVRRVLLIGPPHYVPVAGIAAPSSQAFATPLGKVSVDLDAIQALIEAGLVHIDDAAHAPEHALEVELPFLQVVLASFTIVPLLVGRVPPQQTAAVIAALMDGQTLLAVSTDLSHYLEDRTARARDLASATTIERLDFTRLGPGDACGFSALNGALCAAAERSWIATRLDLRNSGDASGDRSRVVGYGAWALTAAHS